MDIHFTEAVRKQLEAARTQGEITEICLKAGIAAGELTKDAFGNVVVASDQPSIVSQKPGGIDMDDRSTTEGNNLPPEQLEYRK